MSWSIWLGLKAWNFIPLQAQISPPQAPALSQKPAASSYEKARKRCRLTSPKLATYHYCLAEAKRRLNRPPAPPAKPKSELERELGRCNLLGKTLAVQACKREAPKRIEARRKAANQASRLTPLERALNRCRGLGKVTQIFQCRREAVKRYAPAPK